MKKKVYVLEEYVGKFDRDSLHTNFIGIYTSRKKAMQAKEDHLKDIDPECIDGYQLTEMTVRRKGFEICYFTDDLGK